MKKYHIVAYDPGTWIGVYNIVRLSVSAETEEEALEKAKKEITRSCYQVEKIEL